MNRITVNSPAKINFGLKVVEKRDDGYHNLETIFYPLLLSDRLSFEISDKYDISSNSEVLNNMKENLIFKAIKIIEKKKEIELKVRVFVKKFIPIGGGLGGGSSNAASTLKAINNLFNLELSNEELLSLALELGSDVPFFLNPYPSYAEGRGEKLFQINLEIPYPILIINPGINISTRWAFERIKPTKSQFSLQEIFKESKIDFDRMKKYVTNDFEPIVFKEYPQIENIKKELYEKGSRFALMSGTGSTVYGIFSNLQKAYWAEEDFKETNFTYLNNPLEKGSIT